MIEITKTMEGKHVELALSGRLDTNSASQLDDAVFEAVDQAEELVFDFSNLSYVSSAGLRVIVRALDAVEERGDTLVLCNVCDDIMEVFQVTGLDEILTFE